MIEPEYSSPHESIGVPMGSSEARVRLEAQRAQCLDKMVRESDEGERRILLETYHALGIALDSMANAQRTPTKYGSFKQIRNAVTAYLIEIDRSAEKEEIVEALYEGGLRRVEKKRLHPTVEEVEADTKTFVRKSIEFHLQNPRGVKAQVMKQINGKIGLWEWKRDKFT
jgi:hypothetical protein